MTMKCILLLVSVVGLTAGIDAPFRFRDVSSQVGLDPTPQDKVAGPSVADLNGDGFLDILQSNHARAPADVYYGSASGVFRRVRRFVAQGDRHGTCVGDLDGNGFTDAILTIGAVRNLAFLPHVRVELTNPDGSFNLTTPTETGFTQRNGYLFGCRLMDMDGDGDLDLLGQGGLNRRVNNHIFQNLGGGRYRERSVASINSSPFRPFALGYLVTDYNSDSFLDILLYGDKITLFQGGPNFQFTDVTTRVLPSTFSTRMFSTAAQIDIDNDGDFDLYFTGGRRLKGGGSPGADLLLENRGGIFVDISRQAGIPTSGGRTGVGVADFDNDGYMDLFLGSSISQPASASATRQLDIMLRNNGNNTFSTYTNHGATERDRASDRTYPAGLQVFDYNRDGRVDVVVGTRFNNGTTEISGKIQGKIQLFRNIVNNGNNWFVVKVPANIRGRNTMDALIRLQTTQGWLYRRVGSVGEGRSHSFIDQVHFGIGPSTVVQRVELKLIGSSVTITNNLGGVPVNQIYNLRV
eukprot:CAMPEP_0184677870 /NCGR_PEP_ID=MMETSP0312-20130426/485_1 /TAXON_ID=31354 /ORGANISM="Compsopogon coeruleus, Strain SAG 36.94" /LENGTH=520 /DNA_ID=CAMNT_0027126065 /DNA_START=223 /DNA_END=1785 /DNA_ORIENTATION=-